MAETAIIVVDTDASHDVSGVENAVNGLVKRAENSGQPFFYVLPEGQPLADSIEQPPASSILRYEDEDNWYTDARIDEQVSNRNIDKVVIIGPSDKKSELQSKEKARDRSTKKGGNGNNGNGK